MSCIVDSNVSALIYKIQYSVPYKAYCITLVSCLSLDRAVGEFRPFDIDREPFAERSSGVDSGYIAGELCETFVRNMRCKCASCARETAKTSVKQGVGS